MYEILEILLPGSLVLDLGSGPGSFDARAFELTVVRADIEVTKRANANMVVICAASQLPFASQTFQAVILNHSLEHFEDLTNCVSELSRVLAPNGFVYVAVPDASTLTDRIYRWLAKGGGHVNPFTDPMIVRRMIAEATGLKHAATRVLHTSLSLLNRRNITSRPPRKLLLFAYGHEGFLRLFTFLLRCLDRRFGWRTSIYGWAFYFGAELNPDTRAWSNVCVRCGSGHAAPLLKLGAHITSRRLLPSIYRCPSCGTQNFFTEDWTT
jgi:SAM-dependent methyltransferase